ncbi:MAG: hypothetical protein BWK78_04780 [Thiotrichaceae bacterium IS1]|nr:MAG: hypothetical protein BWK78_04780 [Thiotrichaceae bacterium IS1]
MSISLRPALVAIGLFFVCLDILFNVQLFASVAVTWLHKFSFGIVGLLLDVSKILFLATGTQLIFAVRVRNVSAGIICLVFWVALSIVSLTAGYGIAITISNGYQNGVLFYPVFISMILLFPVAEIISNLFIYASNREIL